MAAKKRPSPKKATRASSRKASPAEDEQLAGPPPKRERCAAQTAKGAQCKRLAVNGGELCAVHLGAPVGAKPKLLDEDTQERILAVLKSGGYVETAAAVAGVAKQTFYNAIERGHPDGALADPDAKEPKRVLRKDDQPFREFREKVEQAQAEGETLNLGLIQRAAAKDWKAAAWILERTRPQRYAGPRGRGINSSIHPDDFAAGEPSVEGPSVFDDQVGPDGRPL